MNLISDSDSEESTYSDDLQKAIQQSLLDKRFHTCLMCVFHTCLMCGPQCKLVRTFDCVHTTKIESSFAPGIWGCTYNDNICVIH